VIRRTPSAARPGQIDLRCASCWRPQAAVRSLICGPTPSVAICDECIELCTEINALRKRDAKRSG